MNCITLILAINFNIVFGKYSDTEIFAILTEGCAIPGYPHITDNILQYVEAPQNIDDCSEKDSLVKANSSHLWVDGNAMSFAWEDNTFYCCYKSFTVSTNINNINYGQCKKFLTSITVEDEYVRIECYHEDENVYDDFFLFNTKNKVEYPKDKEETGFNVLILGLESLSRINFHRTMPLTSKFLQDEGIVELFGLNKLGDNSYPNLFPLLTGKSFKYVKTVCDNENTEYFDMNKCEFIWDKFKERGYTTALGSDSIGGVLGHYEYRFPGIPTDFYIQPFMFETRHLFKDQYFDYHHACVGSKYYIDILLDYIYTLTQKLNSNNLFGMFWEESISHEDLNKPRLMDAKYFNLLNSLNDNGYLNNTILFFISDHGMRWGGITLTEQGRIEDRLPLLGILFPSEFKLRYKIAFKNIQENTNRLITHYDVHETILHLLEPNSLTDESISQNSDSNYSIRHESSLFFPISTRRTCESVGIDEHWCACYKGKKYIPGPKMKPLLSRILISHINNLIDNFPACRKLTLDKILHVSLVENDKIWRTYTVIVQTSPGGAIFDGTLLLRKPKTWHVSGTVSRLNSYRNQSSCIKDSFAKMYCFCG